jgi:ubiquinone/menaquinone biosynthesis C-methylase UbiE
MNIEIEKFKHQIDDNATISEELFFAWFDKDFGIEQSFNDGADDFQTVIIENCHPNRGGIALDIGYGGGRILATACKHFDKVIGVDVHTQTEIVSNQLKKMGITNFELLVGDGSTLQIESESINFVYSYIVFQHIGSIEIFKSYLNEIARVLKSGGCGIIYVGRLFRGHEDYIEIDTKVNKTNLAIKKECGQKLIQEVGLTVLNIVCSKKQGRTRINIPGGQYGYIITKK